MSENKEQPAYVPSYKTELARNPSWGPKWLRGLVAFAIGSMLIDTGLTFLGVRIEWFMGINGFDFSWVMAMTILPVMTGVVVGAVYGFGGKYLAHFPPLGVLVWDYYESVTHTLPMGVHLFPWPLWGFFVILQMEFCAVGGVAGELFIRRYYGWDQGSPMVADAEPLPEDDTEQEDNAVVK
ncbi:MAG TPA: hypothetical protein VNI58_00955 [Mariprofundaceae bacterium]|nr:hypothetical protein [Mariprofundaceae bacterium]